MLFSAFSKRRGRGLIALDVNAPQVPGKRDWGFDVLGLSSSALPSEVDLSKLALVLDQGATESCVAQSWEQAIRIGLQSHHKIQNPPLGSRLFGYSNARALHDAERTDRGTYLRSYAYALAKGGNCPESEWPFDPSKVNTPPPPRAFRAAWGRRGIKGYYKIFEQREERSEAVRSALANGYAVVFGTMIDRAFTEDAGPEVIGIPQGNLIGGHAMCIVGYKTIPNYGTLFLVVNSWGFGWRRSGFAWFTEEILQWHYTQDLWVVEL
jgi:C1A family cysteine protease